MKPARRQTDPAYRAALWSAAARIARLLIEGDIGCEALAVRLGVSKCLIRNICLRHSTAAQRRAAAIRKRRIVPWTDADRQFVADRAGKLTVPQICAKLGRSHVQIQRERARQGLTRHYTGFGEDFEQFIRAQHALGWSDAEIAAAWKCDRHSVSFRRKSLGLPHNAFSAHRRQRVAEKTRRQLAAAGLSSLADVQKKVWRERALALGWPTDLRFRAVQILEALWNNGPMTRRELAAAVGMPWKGSRRSLTSNDPEGSYLAHLMKRGLVVSLGRCVRPAEGGKCKNVYLYSLPLWTQKHQPQPERKAG